MTHEDKLNAVRYTEVFERTLLPFMEDHNPAPSKLEQDNAPVRTALHTKDWFLDDGFFVLPCPARSPDCNLIDKLWAFFRKIYTINQENLITSMI